MMTVDLVAVAAVTIRGIMALIRGLIVCGVEEIAGLAPMARCQIRNGLASIVALMPFLLCPRFRMLMDAIVDLSFSTSQMAT